VHMHAVALCTHCNTPVKTHRIAVTLAGSSSSLNTSLVYDLYAVTNHMGGLQGGHYTGILMQLIKLCIITATY
jgi:ubiquitin C-terminal hydrolase